MYGHKWREARLAYLRRNPLCVECLNQGKTVAATEVDHIVPHRENSALFWQTSNWQALCKSHHSAKTLRGQ